MLLDKYLLPRQALRHKSEYGVILSLPMLQPMPQQETGQRGAVRGVRRLGGAARLEP